MLGSFLSFLSVQFCVSGNIAGRRSSKTVNILPGRCVVDWPVSQLICFFAAFHSIQFEWLDICLVEKMPYSEYHTIYSDCSLAAIRASFFPLFRFHILKTLALLSIETLCIYTVAVVYENRYLFIVRSLSWFFSSLQKGADDQVS